MDDFFIKQQKKFFIKKTFEIAILYIIVVIAIFALNKWNINNSENMQGVAEAIVKEKYNNCVVVSYEVDGEEITSIQNTRNTDINIGEKITVNYNKENPQIAYNSNNNDNEPLTEKNIIFFIVLFVITILIGYIAMKKRITLLKSGVKIEAEFCYEENFKLIYKWKDKESNQIYYYSLFNLTPNKGIQKLCSICINQANPKKFLVLRKKK